MRVLWIGVGLGVIGGTIVVFPFWLRMPPAPIHQDHYSEFLYRMTRWLERDRRRLLIGTAIGSFGLGLAWAVALHEWGVPL